MPHFHTFSVSLSILLTHLYYNCTMDLRILASRQKKYEILVECSRTLVQLPIYWPLLLPSFQVLQPLLLHKVWNFGKYYPSYTWQKKYENLVEPSRASQARFSYFFSLLVKICQIFILFQSPGQNLPDCHSFSIFSKFGRLTLSTIEEIS